MEKRLEEELAHLRGRYPDLEFVSDGRWVRIPDYATCPGWNRDQTDVVFRVLAEHPGAQPYGFFVPAGLLFNGVRPKSYTEPAKEKPPFDGEWGFFSWQPESWKPAATVRAGSNLLNWAEGFSNRFREGA